jgi:hypothetical protein
MDDPEDRAAHLARMIDELASRFRTHAEMQAFRAHVLWAGFCTPRDTIAIQLGLTRGSVEGYVMRGAALVARALREGTITREECLRWLRRTKDHRDLPDSPPGSGRPAQPHPGAPRATVEHELPHRQAPDRLG